MNSFISFIQKTYKMARPHERKAVLRNFASLTTLQTVTYILPLIVLPYLFRTLGPDKFGLIAFAQAFVQYFMILTDYGFNISATKEISLCQKEHAKICRVFSDVMTAKLALAFISLAILSVIVCFIPKFRNDWQVYILSFGSVVGNTLFPVWFFQGKEKMKHIADINIVGGIIFALCIFIFVKKPADYLLVPLITSVVFLTTGTLGLYMVFQRFGVSYRFRGYKTVRSELAAGWDIFISIAAINAYTTTRVFTLGLLTNNALTGFYSMAEKIANVFQTFPQASFTQALFPRISRTYRTNKAKAYRFMERLQRISVGISFITLPLGFIFSKGIVKIACGEDYPQAALALRILLAAVFFVRANAFRVQFLLVAGKTHIYSRIHVIMAMIGLPLIFLLIYSYSYAGAAIATVVIEVGIFTITYFTVKRLILS
ncbi:MAG: flippase [Candidatus Omnitrophica bacterium]|nr:flippase [Candidatus Omnitrophota bacterium]